MIDLIKKLEIEHSLSKEEFKTLINNRNEDLSNELFKRAVAVRKEIYSNEVFIRGLIEFTNYCKNDCYYCGIRFSNSNAIRFRLSEEEILGCCKTGYALGYKTFVLQGGEDPFYTQKKIESLVYKIKSLYPDCAVTLSVGEHSKETYKRWFSAGADRYLLRHETANDKHYSLLHPSSLTLENRKRCLYDLKEIGYQVGCGFMVGSPYQTAENLAEDLMFLKEFRPDMVGIGPFIPHSDTPFKNEKAGTLELTLFMLGLTRLLLPEALIPATTALGTIHENGRELGVLAGANVCMPNLSPENARQNYTLYNNKLNSGSEAAENLMELSARMEKIGYKISNSRGDRKKFFEKE